MTRATFLTYGAALALGLGLGCGGEIDWEGGEDGERQTAAYSSNGFAPVLAYRRLDTRSGKPWAAQSKHCLRVAGQNGIPGTARAVAVNLVAIRPSAAGYLVAYPDGVTAPKTSSLNYPPGAVIANGVIVGVGTGGRICLYTVAQTHVVVDVSGYFPQGSGYAPAGPYRRLDTRDEKKPAASGATRCLKVAGRDGVPSTARAVAVNLVAVAPSGAGFLTAFPRGVKRPETSSLNYASGETVANGAIVKIGSEGMICFFVKTATHVILDVSGYFGSGSDFAPITPYRRLDTRAGSQPVAGSTRCLQVGGKNGVPSTARAVAVNLTVVNADRAGHLLARPAGRAQIRTSVLNHAAGEARANNALVQIGARGRICIFTHATAHYILDVVGYWPGPGPFDPITHPRAFDVSSATGFVNALETATSGDTIQIPPTATIDLTGHKELAVPGGVTITGGRAAGVKGPLVVTRQKDMLPLNRTWHLLTSAGSGLVVRGIRLQGPDGAIGAPTDFMAGGINLRHADAVVENSELFSWPADAVAVSGDNVVVRGSYIHHNIRAGRGYGVVVGATKTPVIIERNTFERNRHSVAGSGFGSYLVRRNRFKQSDPTGIHWVIDMHGANEHTLDNSTFQAGVFMHIHNNDFEYRGGAQGIIGIRGIPANVAIVEGNCVADTDSRWVGQYVMKAHDAPVSGQSCYQKGTTWLCHTPTFGAAMKNIVVRTNLLGHPSGCR